LRAGGKIQPRVIVTAATWRVSSQSSVGTSTTPSPSKPPTPHPGKYDENVFKALDWVVAESAKRGLKLMMTLTNFWEDFGGFPQYVRCAWAKGE